MDNTFSDKISDNIFARNKIHEEYQYLNLIENILENGHWEEGRKKVFLVIVCVSLLPMAAFLF